MFVVEILGVGLRQRWDHLGIRVLQWVAGNIHGDGSGWCGKGRGQRWGSGEQCGLCDHVLEGRRLGGWRTDIAGFWSNGFRDVGKSLRIGRRR